MLLPPGCPLRGADTAVEESLARFGRYLGIAFQIVDDLLDVQGDEGTTGKSLGTDLEQRKPTLPLIRLLAQVDATQRGEIIAALDSGSPDGTDPDCADPSCQVALDPWFDASDALSYTRDRARWFADQAQAELAQLPPSEARTVLEVVAKFAIERQH